MKFKTDECQEEGSGNYGRKSDSSSAGRNPRNNSKLILVMYPPSDTNLQPKKNFNGTSIPELPITLRVTRNSSKTSH